MENRGDQASAVRPARMALCEICRERIRETYWIVEDGAGREGLCGFCGGSGQVRSCELTPKVNHAYRRRSGGGERSRAGGRP